MSPLGRIETRVLLVGLLACALLAPVGSSVLAQTDSKAKAKSRTTVGAKVPGKKPAAKLSEAKKAAVKRARLTHSPLSTATGRTRQVASLRAPVVDNIRAIRVLEQELLRTVGRFTQPQDYPREALHAGWTGTALVQVSIDRDGTIRSVVLRDSSGFAVLDDQAVRMVQRVERMRVPAAYQGQTQALTVPIGFQMRAAQPVTE